MIKWTTRRGRVWRTINGTTEGRLYYWIRIDNTRDYKVGYYAFGREVERQGKSFVSLGEAKAYVADYDANIVDSIIVEEPFNA
jgi:hypothetical protein